MEQKNILLRSLPKVDQLIELLITDTETLSRTTIKNVITHKLDEYREAILNGSITTLSKEDIILEICSKIKERKTRNLIKVVNATGVVLHTNLGRAKLPTEVISNLVDVACGYSNVEYNLETGQRGSRYEHVEKLIIGLTGAEAAIVVNNNAAAVYLVLDTLAKGKEVIVSRGELVEIGGSFRIPNIIETSGCKLVEVGTTNKTHPDDFKKAVTEKTGALLKVHTSNYKIIGFTEEVTLKEMKNIADCNNIPVIYDLGCGLLVNLKPFGINGQPTVSECVNEKIDIVCFSGDKLLGGPQAGIIVGKKVLIEKMKKNHLLRALRIDKLTLTALEGTLRQYEDETTVFSKIPTLSMITQKPESLKEKALKLLDVLDTHEDVSYEIIKTEAQVGGGTMPDQILLSYGVAIKCLSKQAIVIEKQLRQNHIPIISRVSKEQVIIDMFTIDTFEMDIVSKCLNKIFIETKS